MKELLERALKALNTVHTGFSESKPLGIATIIDDLQSAIDNLDAEPVCYRIKFTPRSNPYESWIHESNLDYIKELRSSGRPCIIEELYTHPNVVVRLTDEDICGILKKSRNVEHASMLPFALAREVEKYIMGGVND